MKSKISKAHRTIVNNTLNRWAHTLSTGTPNVEKAKECLRAAYTNGIGAHRRNRFKTAPVTFHVVWSPVSFMLAMAVIRGRLSKRAAEEMCTKLNIDSGFLKPLRRDSLTAWNTDRDRWLSFTKTEFSRVWLRAIREEHMQREQLVAETPGFGVTEWANRMRQWNPARQYQLNDLTTLVPTLRSMFNEFTGLETVTREQRSWDGTMRSATVAVTDTEINRFVNATIPTANATMRAVGNLIRAVDLTDLVGVEFADANNRLFLGNAPKAVDAEVLCRILRVDDPAVTWEFEVFHHCTAFAAFQKSCLILADRPQVRVNEEGNLHSTTGPAVEWVDGARLWFNDGHFLDEDGRRIVAQPERLTTTHILRINNEETRRLAIDKFGWERFIAEANCQVLDRRRNDVDNTIELLVGPPAAERSNDRWIRSRQRNRMVLFCRSTGRRYFLSVPGTVNSCQEAQTWMADSGVDTRLPYAKHGLRLLGAS